MLQINKKETVKRGAYLQICVKTVLTAAVFQWQMVVETFSEVYGSGSGGSQTSLDPASYNTAKSKSESFRFKY